jgi:hypothetical protein
LPSSSSPLPSPSSTPPAARKTATTAIPLIRLIPKRLPPPLQMQSRSGVPPQTPAMRTNLCDARHSGTPLT